MISIIVPCYNEEKWIGECLRSIQSQEYEDYEVFIVDNVSTDKTVGVAEEFLRDGRFRLFKSTKHTRNAANGINIGMSKAKGEIATWINADDKMQDNYLTSIIPYFSDQNIWFVRIGIYIWYDTKPLVYEKVMPLPWKELSEIAFQNKVFPGSPYRTKLFHEMGGLFEEMNFFDWDFWVRCALNGCWAKGYKYTDCNLPLTIRKIHRPVEAETNNVDEGARQIIRKYVRREKDYEPKES